MIAQELQRLNGVYDKLLAKAGVTYIEGRGKLVDVHTVDVDGKRYTVRGSVGVCACCLDAHWRRRPQESVHPPCHPVAHTQTKKQCSRAPGLELTAVLDSRHRRELAGIIVAALIHNRLHA